MVEKNTISLDSLDCQDSDAGNKFDFFLIHNFSTNEKVFSEQLMEERNPSLKGTYNFDLCNELLLNAKFWEFEKLSSLMHVRKMT